MRLINTETLQFESFPDSERPPFAILSHRWGKGDHDEITFDDMRDSGKDPPPGKIHGYAKVKGFCALARSMDFKHAWMDTCCIDKSNNTELSEAINSMYRWYSDAAICIAYLQDVGSMGSDARPMEQSEWFTRGWTLQELIAPGDVLFYDGDWTEIGTKKSLLALLSKTTAIPEQILSGVEKPASCSVAQRMSWAAHRRTERVEDRAYSLMGLFDVSLPMIYGEREKAFLKLQQAIIETLDDESIFTWSLNDTAHPKGYSGLLAPSPASFSNCADIISTPGSSGFDIKNGALSISLMTFPYSMDTYYAYLHSTNQNSPNSRFAIFLERLPTEGQYARTRSAQGQSISLMQQISPGWNNVRRDIRVRQDPTEAFSTTAYGFWLRTLRPPGHDDCQMEILSRSQPTLRDRIYIAPGACHTAGIVSLKPKKGSSGGWSQIRWMKFGFDEDFNAVCLIANIDGTRYGLRENAFNAAVESGPESPEHKSLFTHSWIKGEASAPKERGHGWADGAAIYKWIIGSSATRLQTKCLGLNVQIEMNLLPNHLPQQRLPTTSTRPRKIWVVDITQIGDHSPKWDRRKYQCGNWSLCAVGTLFALCGCACCIQEFKEQRAIAK